MTERTCVLDGETISYRVRVSARSRRVSLRSTEDGLEVVRPARLRGPFAPEDLLRRFSRWVLRQARRHAAARAERAAFADRLLLRGRSLAVVARETDLLNGFEAVREEADRLVVETARGRSADAPAAVSRWLFDAARRDLAAAMRRRAAEMAQPHGRITVRDQRWLWGSCSPARGTVSLNAKLVMAPPAVLDYIVVHELAHFRWRGHGVRFWERVARFCPDHRAHRRWLKDHGWRLRFPDRLPVEAPALL